MAPDDAADLIMAVDQDRRLKLLEELPDDASDCHVLLAGGIHDARSAAMAAAAAAPLAARGANVGALMGTAYLFTREATEGEAITPLFQQAAIEATDTALLESGPGHATRCLPSPFVEQFEAERRSLRDAGLRSAFDGLTTIDEVIRETVLEA